MLLLAIDFNSIESTNWERSTAHRFVFGNRNPSTAHGRPVYGYAAQTDDGFIWHWYEEVPPNSDPWDLPGIRLDIDIFRDMTVDEGLYHLTRRTEEVFIWPVALDKATRRKIMQAVLDAFQRRPEYEEYTRNVASLFRKGVTRRVTPIYTGYLRNTIAATLALLAAFCFVHGKTWRWLPNPRDFIERRRFEQGKCPHCGYNLAGVPSIGGRQYKCPECGNHSPSMLSQPGSTP